MRASPRWRVIVVRFPEEGPARLFGFLPWTGWRARSNLRHAPAVVHAGADEPVARRVADGLREQGATVVIVEEPIGGDAFCLTHEAYLAGEVCVVCRLPICARCQLDAGGQPLCARCIHQRRRRERSRRLRQLLLLLALVLVVYEALRYGIRERRWLPPMGPVSVAVVQFVEPGARNAPLLRALNAAGEPTSLTEVANFYQREFERYTGRRETFLHLHLGGPWVETVEPPPLGDPDAGWFQNAWSAFQYPRYFHRLARKHGVDPDGFGARVYVVYGREQGDLAADSRGSRQGRVAIAFIPVDNATPAYAQITVAHELAHVLGAPDQYLETTFRARIPEGLADPWARPPFPQTHAELMAVDVPLSPSQEREATSLDEVRIGHATAAAMGWISAERAAAYYGQVLLDESERRVEDPSSFDRHRGTLDAKVPDPEKIAPEP